MEETEVKFLTKKNIITLLLVLIMLLVIPAGVKLATQQQVLKSRAAEGEEITFTGPNVSEDKTTTTSPEVEVELRSPWSLDSGTSNCQNYYVDADDDGYYSSELTAICSTPAPVDFVTTQGDDCDDQNANVHPGQTGWFTTARANGSFDYNCSATEEKQYPVTTFPAPGTCVNNGKIGGLSGLQDGACGHSSSNLACWQTNGEADDGCNGGNGGWCYNSPIMGQPCCDLGYPDYNSKIERDGYYTQGCH